MQLMSSKPFYGYKIKYGVRAKHFPLMNKITEGLKARVKLGMETITSRHIDDNKQAYR